MLKVPAERQVEPLTIALLRDVKDACAQLGTQFVLAGATARDILMWHLHDIKAPVATRDVDVAVCAVSWEQQKFLFKRSPDDYEIELDVVPFGQIEGPPGEIHWPPGGDIVMTVLGFQEAVDTAEPVDIGEDLVVPVVTLSAFVLLKLFAWKDRRLQKNTDAGDVLFVLRNYFQAGNIERTFEQALDLLEAAGSDPVLAAAGLLGRDVRNLAYPETQAALQALLQAPEDSERLRADLEARAATLLGGFVDDSDALLATFTKELLSMGDANGDRANEEPGGPAAGA